MRYLWIPFLIINLFTNSLLGQKLDHRQGEILVEMRMGLNPYSLAKSHDSFNGRFTDIKLLQICAEPKNIWKISFDHNEINEDHFQEDISRQEEILTAQRNYILKKRIIPDDPRFTQQWQYINDGVNGNIEGIDTDADIAWDITTGGLTTSGDTIVVCVIDDGLDVDHEDIAPNLWFNRFEIPDNGVDDDNNGYVDDYRGWDAIELDDNITRDGSHGTSVTGIVGAVGNNGIGVAGVNWNVKLMILRGGSAISDAIGSYAYIYTQRKRYNDTNGSEGAFVVATNASWGFDMKFEEEAPMLCEFYDELGQIGVVSAAATTNENNTDVDVEGDLPTNCSSPFLIAVTNLTSSGIKKEGAGIGVESIDMAAPGAQVITTSRNNGYTSFAGTSGSAPHVAGLVGLMYAAPCSMLSSMSNTAPEKAAQLVKDIIIGSVTQNETLTDITFTGGHLNIGNAVTIANNLCDGCPAPTELVAQVNASTIDISWQAPSGSETDIRYRQKGNLAWKRALAVTSPFEIPNLDECTMYEVQLRSSCGDSGPYSHSYYYTTDNCCRNPETIDISNENNAINVMWEDISAAVNYTLEFREVPNTDWISITTTNNQFNIENVFTCSGFDFRLKTNCSKETIPFGFSYQSNINCNTCSDANYCEIGFMDNAFEFIDAVSINDRTFNSGLNLRGYASFVGNTGIFLKQGEIADIAIRPGFTQGAFSENASVYIDWDQNGMFEAEELAYSATSFSEQVMGQITVPTDALSGLTRMRVILSFDDINGPCPTDGLEFGEVEDYCVTVQSSAPCETTVQIESIHAKSSEISLTWTEINEASNYTIQYREEGMSAWIEETSMASSLVIAGLSKCTSYQIRVKANCSGTSSEFSTIDTLSTRCGTSVYDPQQIVSAYTLNPNPFELELTLDISSERNYDSVQISVFNVQGNRIAYFLKSYNQGKVRIDELERLASGLYILEAKTKDFTVVERIIKIK